jgi:hypothetical protein
MSSNIIYPQGGGGVEITVPAAESIAVYTKDVAQVYRKVGYPQIPESTELLGVVTNGQTVFGPYASGATVIIEGGAADVLYQVGTAPVVLELYDDQLQGAPAAKTTAVTLTAAELLTGIITGTHTVGGTAAYTLPTGALLDAALEMAIGESFDWVLINLSAAAADTVTVTATTGHTVVGTMIVASAHATTGLLYGNAAQFRTRKTAADTFVTYRIG